MKILFDEGRTAEIQVQTESELPLSSFPPTPTPSFLDSFLRRSGTALGWVSFTKSVGGTRFAPFIHPPSSKKPSPFSTSRLLDCPFLRRNPPALLLSLLVHEVSLSLLFTHLWSHHRPLALSSDAPVSSSTSRTPSPSSLLLLLPSLLTFPPLFALPPFDANFPTLALLLSAFFSFVRSLGRWLQTRRGGRGRALHIRAQHQPGSWTGSYHRHSSSQARRLPRQAATSSGRPRMAQGEQAEGAQEVWRLAESELAAVQVPFGRRRRMGRGRFGRRWRRRRRRRIDWICYQHYRRSASTGSTQCGCSFLSTDSLTLAAGATRRISLRRSSHRSGSFDLSLSSPFALFPP